VHPQRGALGEHRIPDDERQLGVIAGRDDHGLVHLGVLGDLLQEPAHNALRQCQALAQLHRRVLCEMPSQSRRAGAARAAVQSFACRSDRDRKIVRIRKTVRSSPFQRVGSASASSGRSRRVATCRASKKSSTRRSARSCRRDDFKAEALATRIAELVRERQGAERAEVTVAARYPEHKPAPVFGVATQEIYMLYGMAAASAHGTRRLVGVAAQGLTACQCARRRCTS